jgi:hypothetical protein
MRSNKPASNAKIPGRTWPAIQQLQRGWEAWDGFWFGGVDSRIYGLFRIAFSLVSFVNLIDLWPYRQAFLSPNGMIDRGTLYEAIGKEPYYSLFFHIGSQEGVTAACISAGLAMVTLGLGIFPRLAAIVVFVWHISFSHAAFPALIGWDNILRVYSFLLMISPLGEVWSLPNWLRRVKREDQIAAKLVAPQYGLVLMRIQLAVIYFDSAWSKVNDEYWRSGQLIPYYMMSIYARYPNTAWADQLLLGCLMTWGSLAIEIALPALILLPRTRRLALWLGVALHLGIAATSTLSLFSWTILAAYVSLLTQQDMDWLSKLVVCKGRKRRP